MKQDQIILASKVQIPPQKADIVTRPRLIEKLDQIFQPGARLALVLAPPGFGKSLLVNDWAHQQDADIVWFSLDESDNHPVTFWRYFIAALQETLPKFLSPVNFNDREFKDTDVHRCLVHLINKFSGVNRNLVFILDDLHHVTSPSILSELKFLVEHLPATMKMVITSHQEPDWPLAKYRAKDVLVEIRVDELEFSTRETCELLHKMNLNGFTQQEVDALVEKSEGWVFGIQLAAIAASDNKRPQSLESLSPRITEYLVSEVFTDLPPDVQEFLLEISILDSLNASLCATITGRDDAGRLLRLLEQKNLFLLPVDEQHEWYRFHRLFLDLLRARLNQTPADRVRSLHARASEWYEYNDRITAAVDHALRSENYERAVTLVEKNIFQMMDHSELLRQSELVSKLPPSVLQSRPELTIANAWLLAYTGNCTEAEHYLLMVENSLRSMSLKSERRRIVGRMLAVQSYTHWLRGDNEKTIKAASQALINLESGDTLNRGVTLISLANALEGGGFHTDALEAYTEAIETCCHGDCTHIHVLAASAKARLMLMMGQIQQVDLLTAATIKKVLEKNPGQAHRYPALGNLYANRAEVFLFRYNFPSALEMADEGVRLGQHWRHADTTITIQGIRSAVLWKMGHKEEVFKILEELRPLTSLVSSWYLNYLDAYLILLGVEPERLKSTCRWFDIQEELSASDFNHSDAILCRARARILYSNKHYSEALNWLALIQKDSERTGTRMYVADAQVMQAICHYRLGDKEEASKYLGKALEFILAERAYSILLDKDEAGRELLEGLTFEPPLAEDINFLLGLARAPRDVDHGSSANSLVAHKQSKTAGLSVREKEILSYLATHKTSIEIAEGLTVSANTIRFHIKSIYNKLDVHSRDEAIERARQLNLI